MGKLSTLITALLSLVTAPVLAETEWEACPHWRGLHEMVVKLPDWPVWTEWPKNDSRTRCATALNKNFSRSNAHTSVTLHQTHEYWQHDPRKDQLLLKIEDAINAALDLFGTHAGTAEAPLRIHITVHNTTRPPESTSYVFIDDEFAPYNTGIASPCNLIIVFPEHNATDPLLKLKKDIVKNMYHCVQYYHHPTVHVLSGQDWWFHGIARFLDGIIWPTPPELIPSAHSSGAEPPPEFPELYLGYLSLGRNDQAASLLWHWAFNSGWSLGDITDWMRQHPSKTLGWERHEAVALSADEKITSLFHTFARAAVAGDITYPSGTPVSIVPTYWGEHPWDRSNLYDVQLLSPGERRDLLDGRMPIDPWKVYRDVIPLAAGQVIDISLRHRDHVIREEFIPVGRISGYWWQDVKVAINEVDNTTVWRDVEWAWREKGEGGRFKVVKWNETARIEVPGILGQGRTEYEVVYACTGGYKAAPVEFVMERV
ncbi:hypothetical protein B0T16DRAFT_456953 [Cercophora newfieldiana]|uniref:Uncharacterized protein n=1 Tax=Cercophora newfieldiana TaxID=92897 RepID=A0AA39YEI2_9PEZI|nr:hypothetical protein B0T16DRAFT_456953 [Cercophora newfieldiana]